MEEHSFEEQLHTALKAESDWKIKIRSSTEVIVTNGFPVVLFSSVVRNALDNIQPEESPVIFLKEFSSVVVRNLVELIRSGFVYATEVQLYELSSLLDVLGISREVHNFTVESIDEVGSMNAVEFLFNNEFHSNPASPSSVCSNMMEDDVKEDDQHATNEQFDNFVKKSMKRIFFEQIDLAPSKRTKLELNYKCTLCDFSCKKKAEIAVHKFEHFEESNECEWCGQLFSMAIQKIFHFCTKPDNNSLHVCIICNVKFPQKCIMLVHQQQHTKKNLSCAICFKETKSVGNLLHHTRCHTEEVVVACNHNKKNRCIEDSINNFSACDVTSSEMIHCTVCTAVFTTILDKVNHKCRPNMRSHKNWFICKSCGKEFAEKCVHLVHLLQHLKPPQSFECPVCFQFFPIVLDLLTHIRFTHTKEIHSTDKATLETVPFSGLQCRKCSATFTVKSHLILHEIRHEQNVNFLTCKFCSEPQENIASALNHIEKHMGYNSDISENIQCSLCRGNVLFGSEIDFFLHREERHNEYCCFMCKSIFHDISSLILHFKSHGHELVESFVCKSCTYCAFESVEEAVLHYSNKVSKTNNHYYLQHCICPFCGIRFENTTSVMLHTKNHLGSLKFTCSLCQKLMTFIECRFHFMDCKKTQNIPAVVQQ